MNLLVLCRYGDLGASSRMRVLQYVPFFEAAGIKVEVVPLFSNTDLERRYASGSYGARKLVKLYFARAMSLLNSKTDVVWIEKELIPWAPAWFETFLLGSRRYVMDFDDAIFHSYDEHRIGLLRMLYGQKIDRLMARANLVIAGNDYLADRARKAGCQRVEIVPTVIDLERYPVTAGESHHATSFQSSNKREVVVGWIGSPYTTRYLDFLEKPLTDVSREEKIRFRVIGAREIDFPEVNVESLAWQESEEANMLSGCDIGVMPLPNSPWERGKCGYKLIQYMACAKPVIGSPIGVNTKIVSPDVGFLCQEESEWYDALLKLTRDPELRQKMGRAGRAAVEQRYCIQKTAPELIEYLHQV